MMVVIWSCMLYLLRINCGDDGKSIIESKSSKCGPKY
ncbi:hypothetical protein ECANGB1_2707 [Enterospora canceri]|uniref:Uncharacterized protein n=1 Tax=Enterospora canceri TaxID=1081671 RepID=A0A1Y1S659_9MICR|nr:hypothetical protein ECANGB1_2722 [Enterospora canceri]ORD93496.1 hypothetical protein ECANGB1_2720 [Enterospora canceri]ORD93914.1 hypothetical protein ECANGB1_2707 [Enterospora canceri]